MNTSMVSPINLSMTILVEIIHMRAAATITSMQQTLRKQIHTLMLARLIHAATQVGIATPIRIMAIPISIMGTVIMATRTTVMYMEAQATDKGLL
jgi:hypothetical protein